MTATTSIPNTATEAKLEEAIFGGRISSVEEIRLAEAAGERESGDLALSPLIDKVAYGLARILVVAMRDLESHIATETRKVGDSVGRRLDLLQTSVQDLAQAASEQRTLGLAVQEKCQQLAAATAGLQERDAHHEAELAGLRSETRAFSASVSDRMDAVSRDLGVQQEDLTAVKSTLGDVSSRIDTIVERLDRQADALRSMYASYAQRETALEQLMEGFAKLRAYPAPVPAARL